MLNLSTPYMGLSLKNPIIVGSSGMTNSIEHLVEAEKNGAGAVVLKSIFEEQIRLESEKFLASQDSAAQQWKSTFENIVQEDYYYEEALQYISNFAKEHSLNQYLDFVRQAKKNLSIPVIASIHCVSQYDWQYFAKRIQEAGADALELNVYVLPSDFKRSGAENEQIYFDIIKEVKRFVSIPFALKIGYYFSGLAQTLQQLSQTEVSALVLFNRPYNPDIDINTLKVVHSQVFSSPEEYANSLRWTAILAGRLDCDLSASTGIHDYQSLVKQLLAGATTVQVASTIFKNGFGRVAEMLNGLRQWMEEHQFRSIDEFRGKLSQIQQENPAAYERVQFMKLYSKIE